MSQYVVDASVAAKWFVNEEHSAAAGRLRKVDHELIGPDLLPVEVGSALLKKVRRGELSAAEGESGARLLTLLPIRLQAALGLLPSAWAIANRYTCSLYESIYVALAVEADCELVTADRKLFDMLAGTPLAEHLLWVEALP